MQACGLVARNLVDWWHAGLFTGNMHILASIQALEHCAFMLLCSTDMSHAFVIKSERAHLGLVKSICELQIYLSHIHWQYITLCETSQRQMQCNAPPGEVTQNPLGNYSKPPEESLKIS